ncbi:NAD(P)/FAD-dependent oxidoreductase [Pseudomonas frederiksbergensis]|uniref:NAD(P)/FAD-dependent oxidoreductase n=1 Tax=Pseudomonas frederiksbergensis TaxID=104087 RepID=UPI003CFCCCB8
MKNDYDYVVVGGGLVGMAIAYGLAKRGVRTLVLDGEDSSVRAARGNFGLVWVSSKGSRQIDYARWSLESSQLWPGFCQELEDASGMKLGYEKPGGIMIAMNEESLASSAAALAKLHAQDSRLSYEVLDHGQLADRIPAVGPDVVGAVYSPHDGHVSPLYTLRGLFAGFERAGGVYRADSRVDLIVPRDGGFRLTAGKQTFDAGKVVLCAGLGNRDLAPMVGLRAPVVPLRGQILVTERVKRFLDYPTLSVRQTAEGSLLLGDSAEDVDMDDGVTPGILAHIAQKAIAPFPLLKNVRVVRAWGSLRIMTPDSMPVYEESLAHPGAFVALCHSGVTLAAAHCEKLVPWLMGAPRPSLLDYFYAKRFAV